METIRGYTSDNGYLTIISLLRAGNKVLSMAGQVLDGTEDIVELLGWPDARARIYRTDGGVEVLVPEEDRGS